MEKNITIRPERVSDYQQVEDIIRQAFYNLYTPGCTEHYLAHAIRPHPDFLPELDLVLGPTGVVGLLGGVSVTGFAMAVFMSNAGGAWDNAKKYIEGGHHGGKGSECHKASGVGDTVGDPFKDTSGPSLNILIKLCSTVSIVFSGLIVAFNLMNLL